jgi:hypothetical protein
MFRFAPDGKQIAYVDRSALVLAELSSGTQRTLGSIDAQNFLWMEWVRGGPVLAARMRTGPRTITFFPVEGAPRLVARHTEHIYRVVGTPSSMKLVWFTERGIFTGDAGSSEPRQLSNYVVYALSTAEMAPNGSEAAWSDDRGMRRIDVSTGKLTRLGHVRASSLWYASDGAMLAYAGYANAYVRHGDEVKRLLPKSDGEIRALRFRRGAAGLLVVKRDDLLAWDPDRNSLERITHADYMIDGDMFRGGVVVMVSHPDPRNPPREG